MRKRDQHRSSREVANMPGEHYVSGSAQGLAPRQPGQVAEFLPQSIAECEHP